MAMAFARNCFRKNISNPRIRSFSTSMLSSDQRVSKSLSDIPGPISLPVIGTAWNVFRGASDERLEKRLLSLQVEDVKRYGPIHKQSIGGTLMIQLADPSDAAKSIHNDLNSLPSIIIARSNKRLPEFSLPMALSGTSIAACLANACFDPNMSQDMQLNSTKLLLISSERCEPFESTAGQRKQMRFLELTMSCSNGHLSPSH